METGDAMDVDVMETPSTNRVTFEVGMYGDTVCPWCYLGKKSLDAAIQAYTAKYPDDVFDITWKPFILWPNAEVSAYDKKAPLVRMAGPLRAPDVFDRLDSTGAEYGVHFNWEGLVGNSADANKLVLLAYETDQKLKGLQRSQTPSPPDNLNTTNHVGVPIPSPSSQPSPPPSPKFSSPSVPTPHQSASEATKNPILNTTQHAFLEALFYTSLTQGFDPSDRAFLITLALSMDPPLVARPSELIAYLDSEEANLGVGLDPSFRPPVRSIGIPPRVMATTIPTRAAAAAAAAAAASVSATNGVVSTTTSDSNTGTAPGSGSGPGCVSGGAGGGGSGVEEQAQVRGPGPKIPNDVANVAHNNNNTNNNKKRDNIRALINAVPSVVVQGRYRVGGMQKAEVYLRVFEKVREIQLASRGKRTQAQAQ